MTARTHPFHRKTTLASYQEKAVFWALRAFTYVTLLFGLIIFATIIYKGSPAVFGSFRVDGTAPFIHNDFLFTKPQTLHVFKYKGKVEQMSAADYYAFVGQDVTPAPAATPAPAPTPTPAPAPAQATETTPAAAPAPSAPVNGTAPATAPAPAAGTTPTLPLLPRLRC